MPIVIAAATGLLGRLVVEQLTAPQAEYVTHPAGPAARRTQIGPCLGLFGLANACYGCRAVAAHHRIRPALARWLTLGGKFLPYCTNGLPQR